MYKLIIPVCFLVQFCSFAQVTIREEINLSSFINSSEPVKAISPSYGRAQVFINRPMSGNCQWPAGYVCFHVTAGSQYNDNGCCNCIRGSCFSGSSSTINFLNLPKGTEVVVTAKKCSLGIWKEVPPISYVKVTDSNYELWGNLTGSPPCKFGFVKFFSQTPPGCPIASDTCDDYELPLPDVKLVQQPVGYQGWECPDDNCNVGGFTKFVENDSGYQYSFNKICFNKQSQKWWFRLNDDNSFLINYVTDICEPCSTQELVDDWKHFPLEYGCENIIRDVRAHLKYDKKTIGPITFYGIFSKYLMKDIFLKHEEEHVVDFQQMINLEKLMLDGKLRNMFDEDSLTCNRFGTEDSTRQYFENKIKEIFKDWREKFFQSYNNNNGTNWNEEDSPFFKELMKELWFKHEKAIHDNVMSKYYNWLLDSVRAWYNCPEELYGYRIEDNENNFSSKHFSNLNNYQNESFKREESTAIIKTIVEDKRFNTGFKIYNG